MSASSTTVQTTGIAATTTTTKEEEDEQLLNPDPLLLQSPLPTHVRENDHILLHFGDGKQIFAHCVRFWRGKSPPVKISKRSYSTANIIGLPYGTVLELGFKGGLRPLAEGEDVMPDVSRVLLDGRGDSTADGAIQSGRGGGGGGKDDDDAMMDIDDTTSSSKPTSSAPVATPAATTTTTTTSTAVAADNRHLIDNNTSQSITQTHIEKLRDSDHIHGSDIVKTLIANSSTFDTKTTYSKAKYIVRKQHKYQPRCRIVRCTSATICEALYIKEPRKMLNLRDDTLAQILSYGNVCAGCQVLVFDMCMGVIVGALAQRMGGYGKVIALYGGNAPAFGDTIDKFNLSFGERMVVKWLHCGEALADDVPGEPMVTTTMAAAAEATTGTTTTSAAASSQTMAQGSFGSSKKTDENEKTTSCAPQQPMTHEVATTNNDTTTTSAGGSNSHNGHQNDDAKTTNEEEAVEDDPELLERQQLQWPCPLQPHTRQYLSEMSTTKDQTTFLTKRCARFARKLTRPTTNETIQYIFSRQSDSLIIATKYDPTSTLVKLLPRLAPSCPFVLYCEFLEPLATTFREVQKLSLAINLRLTDTWMREYQVLEGRTHPNMSMSQNGGFILTGIKLCPVSSKNELDEKIWKELKLKGVGSRRGRKGGNNKGGGGGSGGEGGEEGNGGNGRRGSKNHRGKKNKGGGDNGADGDGDGEGNSRSGGGKKGGESNKKARVV